MIESISLKATASYSYEQAVEVKNLSRVNIFYGHNGTGKSTIGNLLQDSSSAEFANCSLKYSGETPEYMVFNERFIEKNFQQGWHPGVFTLSEGNVIAETAIAKLEGDMSALIAERENIKRAGIEESKCLEKEKEKLKSEAWRLKKQCDSGGLKYCFKGYHSDGSKFLERLLDTEALHDQIASIAELEMSALEITSTTPTVRDLPAQVFFGAQNIEVDKVLSESVVGTGDSYLKDLISKIGNSDWVRQSLTFISAADGKCPLCQQPAPERLEEHIGLLFDETYKEKISYINDLHEKYDHAVSAFLNKLRNDPQYAFTQPHKDALESAIREFEAVADKNLNLLEVKNKNPSEKVQLSRTHEAVQKIKSTIQAVADEATQHNEKIAAIDKTLADINNKVWGILRNQLGPAIAVYACATKEINGNLASKREAIKNIGKKLAELSTEISAHRATTSNMDQAIKNINSQTEGLGLQGFRLERQPGDIPRYRIVRENETEGVFKTLSEGEKTLITFLYFLECCAGVDRAESKVILANRIIVIDDPISSLSHNYIYDVATLVHNQIIKSKNNYRQVFILTHNLFFYHELIRQAKKWGAAKYSYFRVTKAQHSVVTPMQSGDIQNDYQSYWNVLLDARKGLVNPVAMPNMMRNILEHYFAFIHREDFLEQCLNELSESDLDFKPLWRYINRGSHSDAINISDFGAIDPDRYLVQFRRIFEATGHIEHYRLMVGEE